ncbi:MAG: toll/interleukin-1 receptor domain-containing protein [Chitinophagaceae bacterium]
MDTGNEFNECIRVVEELMLKRTIGIAEKTVLTALLMQLRQLQFKWYNDNDDAAAVPELKSILEQISEVCKLIPQSGKEAAQINSIQRNSQKVTNYPSAAVAPPPQKKNNTATGSLWSKLNPFKKSRVFEFNEKGKEPAASPPLKHMTRAKPPDSGISGAAPPEETPQVSPPAALVPAEEGRILYDIPGTMTVKQQTKCIVRIGENETIVQAAGKFSPAAAIEAVQLSNIMRVDLIDIADLPKFSIKAISEAEQLFDKGSYTEWVFYVTPLEGGVFPLVLKVSIIKIIDGKERRKDLIFEKPVSIVAGPAAPAMIYGAALQPAGQQTSNTILKNLSAEHVTELDPPNVFISYAHKDKTYFDIFLANLSSQCDWHIWTDKNIEIGSNWFESIQQSMQQSDCAVLLISSDFISSAFIKEHEFTKFNELLTTRPGFVFLPVFLRDCDFTRWQELSKLQLFVANGDEYGIADKKGQLVPFAKLCRFDNNAQLIPNDNIDTYFKNLVLKAKTALIVRKKGMPA